MLANLLGMLPKIIFALLFVGGGVNHFLKPQFYLRMMPSYIPAQGLMVQLSGVLEVVLGVLLLIPQVSQLAAWGLIALLVAVFPANLHMALNADQFSEMPVIGLWIRLPIQGLLIYWAYRYTRA